MDFVYFDCLFMYCLFVYCGEEIFEKMFDYKNVVVWDEVENCLYV